MMRAVALLVLMTCAGCLNPDDLFPVHGRVVSNAGVEGVRVELYRSRSAILDCDFTGLEPLMLTSTAADGTYAFEVLRAQAQSLTTFQSFCFEVRAHFDSGAESFTTIHSLDGKKEVATLYDWQPHPRFEGEVIHFEPVVPASDAGLQASVVALHRAQVVSGGDVVFESYDWLASVDGDGGVPTALRLPPEALEDFSGEVKLEARIRTAQSDSELFGGGPVEDAMVQTTDRLPVMGTERSLIRGLPCSPEGLDLCALNDGELSMAVFGGSINALPRVTLPVARPVRAVVLRGVTAIFNRAVLTGVTPDGGAAGPFAFEWQSPVWKVDEFQQQQPRGLPDGGFEFPQLSGDFVVLPVDAGVLKRLQLDFPGGLLSAEEVSVF